MMINGKRRLIVVVLILCCLALTACAGGSSEHSIGDPAEVEAITGTDLRRVNLTPEAAKRLDITMAPIRDGSAADGTARTVIPYAAVLYDPQGATWAYTSPKPLSFVRAPIKVDRIDGDLALLSDGPPAGTDVVTVGASELYGAEIGIGDE
jgi:hypothetical protein